MGQFGSLRSLSAPDLVPRIYRPGLRPIALDITIGPTATGINDDCEPHFEDTAVIETIRVII